MTQTDDTKRGHKKKTQKDATKEDIKFYDLQRYCVSDNEYSQLLVPSIRICQITIKQFGQYIFLNPIIRSIVSYIDFVNFIAYSGGSVHNMI